jgi:hypothetical protein
LLIREQSREMGIVTEGKAVRGPAIVLLFALLLLASLGPSRETSQCVCGPKKVLLVLAEFPEYQHISSRDEISTLFFSKVARYFHDISYGMVTVTGNSTDWVMLPQLYSQYLGSDFHTRLVNVAHDAFFAASQSFNFTSFQYVFLVLSFYPSLTGDYVPTSDKPISTKTGSVQGFAIVEEDRDWTTYAHAFALALGLWRLQAQLAGIGPADLAAGGTGDMSAWSKRALGWINSSQLVAVGIPASRVVTLDPVENPGTDPLALQIDLGAGAGQYWVEVRQNIGYDANNLQGYGATVSYVTPTNSSIEVRKVLQPDVISEAVFIDTTTDLSIVALNATQGTFSLLIGSEQDGRNAQTAVYAISRAEGAIQDAETTNRFNNLDLAQTLLSQAHEQFALGKLTNAYALAVSSEATANAATVPPEYSQALQLIQVAEALKNSTLNAGSFQSATLVAQGNAQLEAAHHAFDARDFARAKLAAQSAVDIYNRAKQSEFIDAILNVLSYLVLIVPVLVLAFAIRYQLKGT